MRNKIVVHAHFYQPPREDPWTGVVPYQESAQPYHDWNHRIEKECYATNGMSRTLNPNGQITDIVNNYKRISFNFGPTLLSWLKLNSPYVYRIIIEADKASLAENNGHGNAIAQSYNHTILPLATPEDAKTQIIWGLADFESHFGRKAEGMWLPEAAVNSPVIDMLIREKVSFIVLSPWQAEAICPIGSNKWQPLNNNPIPTGRAYRIDRPEGSINVFFYNHILAHGISFEHYLRNAERLYEKFLSFRQAADPTYLINVATDGEVYGHHEPFGDMCLSAFCKILDSKDDFTLTNYGAYLEANPPTYLVKLKDGEGALGTSWSCFHGVGRWYRNCGCATGGEQHWNQEWRTPLRNAFNYLNTKLMESYVKNMAGLTTWDPIEVRNAYVEVLTGATGRDEFAKRFVNKSDHAKNGTKSAFYTLLEQQKLAQFMFTSCGWFFSEISGLEATQNMKYAVKALDMYGGDNKHEILSVFLSELENARSNIPSFGSGRNIIESLIIPSKKDTSYGASIFILSDMCDEKISTDDTYGIFRRDGYTIEEKTHTNIMSEKAGSITVTDYTVNRTDTFQFSIREEALKGISLFLEGRFEDGTYMKPVEIQVDTLPIELRAHITKTVSNQVVDTCVPDLADSLAATQNALVYLKRMNVQLEETLVELAELLIDRMIEKLLDDPSVVPNEDALATIGLLTSFAKEHAFDIDKKGLKSKISSMISYQIGLLTKLVEEETSRAIILLMETARSLACEPEITQAQEIVFQFLVAYRNYSIMDIEKGKDFDAFNRIRRLVKLGSVFGIDVEEFKERFFSV
jgi:hypothetical protein